MPGGYEGDSKVSERRTIKKTAHYREGHRFQDRARCSKKLMGRGPRQGKGQIVGTPKRLKGGAAEEVQRIEKIPVACEPYPHSTSDERSAIEGQNTPDQNRKDRHGAQLNSQSETPARAGSFLRFYMY